MVKVAYVYRVESGEPTTWSGRSDQGREVYARCEKGSLQVTVGGVTTFMKQVGNPGDQALDYQGLVSHTREFFSWPESEKVPDDLDR